MTKRRQVTEIFLPVLGLKSDAPTNALDLRSQPEGRDFKTYFGLNQKEYGTSLFHTGDTGVGVGASLVFEAPYSGGSSLQIVNQTGVFKYVSGSDSFTNDGQTFTSTYTDYWRGVMHEEYFIYTNGVENIQYKPALASTGTDMNSAVTPSTLKAWDVQSVRGHLVLYHVIEDGTEHFKRVQWTKKSPLTPAGTNDFDTGTSGAIDLPNVEGEIQCAVPMGQGVATVFADRSIHLQFWVGGDEVYRFEKMISGVGTPSRRGAISYEGVAYFMGQDSIYSYHGGTDLREIGKPIKKRLFEEFDENNKSLVWVEFDGRWNEFRVHIPTGDHSDGQTDTVYTYRLADKSWNRSKRSYTAAGRSIRPSNLTIGELVGNIGAQNFKFGDVVTRAGARLQLYTDQLGYVAKYDPTIYSYIDSGTSVPQTFIYQTPDISGHKGVDPYDKDVVNFGDDDKRWTEYVVELYGQGTANVSYSIDKGKTFDSLPGSPVTMIADGTYHSFDVEDRSRELRIQITNSATNETIAVGYQKVEFIPGSEQRKQE